MTKLNPSVDGYLRKSKHWQAELHKLRAIVLDSGLTEEVKWRAPCYTLDGNNVVMLGRFNTCCVISFIKGALLKDAAGILEKPGENTQSARVVRFTDVEQVIKLEQTLKAYVLEAIDVERSGVKVEFKKVTEFAVPDEFQVALDADATLKAAFESLTPGRRRAYLLHFSSAKQSKTRAARVAKCSPQILAGKGLDDD